MLPDGDLASIFGDLDMIWTFGHLQVVGTQLDLLKYFIKILTVSSMVILHVLVLYLVSMAQQVSNPQSAKDVSLVLHLLSQEVPCS